MKKENSMLNGKILFPIVIFALPLLGSSIVQQLYNTADLLFVSNCAGKTAAAAVGASGLIFTCLIGVCTGLSVGVNILVARAVGEDKPDYAKYVSQTAVIISIVTGVFLSVIGLAAAKPVLRLMQTPETILPEALVYLRTYLCSMPFMVIYNMGSSVLRGYGNSKTPFLILIVGGCANVCADFLFVSVLRWGVFGAALATLICQGISSVLILIVLFRGRDGVCVSGNWKLPDGKIMRKILVLSVPVAVQAIVVTLSNIIVQSYINSYGEDTIAAFAAYFRIECFIYLPLVAIGQAMTTFVGQNAGAGNYQRIKKGATSSACLCAVLAFGVGMVLMMAHETVFGWFLKDPAVIEIGTFALRVQLIALFFQPLALCANMLFQSIGANKQATFLAILRSGVYFIPLVVILPHFIGLTGVQIAQTISDVLTFLTAVPFVFRFFRRLPEDGEPPAVGRT